MLGGYWILFGGCAILPLWGWSCLWCGGPGQRALSSAGQLLSCTHPGPSFPGRTPVLCMGLHKSKLTGGWRWAISLHKCRFRSQWSSSRNTAPGLCIVVSRGTLKNLSPFPFCQTDFLRCRFLQGLFFIEMYPFSNRCMVYVCSNYRRCCPFHLCLHNPVWHHVIKVYVLCSLSSLLISLAFSLAIQNQYHCSSLNKKWSVEQGPNVHTDNLQQLDAVLTNDHPTGW